MNNIYFELILILFTYFLINYILKKNSLLIDNIQSSTHKREIYSRIDTPLSGGLLFLLFFSFYYFKYNNILIFFLFTIYLLGLLADLNLLRSPKIRFLFQISILVFYIFFTNTEIISTSIPFFDNLSRLGVLISLPYTPRSEYPRSSATINIIFGRSSDIATEQITTENKILR